METIDAGMHTNAKPQARLCPCNAARRLSQYAPSPKKSKITAR